MRSSSRVGKWRYKVPGATPPCLAMSSKLVFAPDLVNASLATSRIRSRLRCASVRGFRSTDCERFLGIQKHLQPETVSGNLVMRRLSPFYQIRDSSSILVAYFGIERASTRRRELCVSLSLGLQASSAPQSFRNSSARVIRCSASRVRTPAPHPLPPLEPMYIAVHSKILRACVVEGSE